MECPIRRNEKSVGSVSFTESEECIMSKCAWWSVKDGKGGCITQRAVEAIDGFAKAWNSLGINITNNQSGKGE